MPPTPVTHVLADIGPHWIFHTLMWVRGRRHVPERMRAAVSRVLLPRLWLELGIAGRRTRTPLVEVLEAHREVAHSREETVATLTDHYFGPRAR